jgi:hypothetical protein
MRLLVFLVFTSVISFHGTGQIYYSLGLKGQRVNFLAIYETGEDDYMYDPETGDWVIEPVIDTSLRRFYSFGPTLCYGYHHDITEKISVAGELEGFLGLLNIRNSGFYFDFSLGARTSYTFNSSSYSNVFLRLGIGYGMERASGDANVIGVNWRLGYEHDFDNYLLGIALDGNVFLEPLGYGSIGYKESLIAQRLNSIGVVAYFSLGKIY